MPGGASNSKRVCEGVSFMGTNSKQLLKKVLIKLHFHTPEKGASIIFSFSKNRKEKINWEEQEMIAVINNKMTFECKISTFSKSYHMSSAHHLIISSCMSSSIEMSGEPLLIQRWEKALMMKTSRNH
uniref:Uncharacterized protein n=1 Tax=Rousettus aegyptiacus TaxID=9407 RepID=A0A7J8GBP7_ROUAE|nr:hypothetical protein HJG63_011647 [Rousettus aegyptiacus]